MSRVLVVAILLFVAVASSALLWEGLALGAGHARAVDVHERRRERLRLVVGALGFALVVWVALGLVTHAW